MPHKVLITASGDYAAPIEGEPPDLKPLVKAALGGSVRRVGRFIQLALIGVGACVGHEPPSPDTAVYLSSARGDLETTVDVLDQIFRAGEPPAPFDFINTVSNAACFYVAKQWELKGRSLFVSNRTFTFEIALQLALLDLESGVTQSALIGSVDMFVAPEPVFRRRLDVGPEAILGEGSHWLRLTSDSRAEALGQVAAVEFFENAQAFLHWAARQSLEPARTAIAAGRHIAASDWDAVRNSGDWNQVFGYREGRGAYDTQSGAVIGHFLREAPAHLAALLHVDGDRTGRLAAMLVLRMEPSDG